MLVCVAVGVAVGVLVADGMGVFVRAVGVGVLVTEVTGVNVIVTVGLDTTWTSYSLPAHSAVTSCSSQSPTS